MSSINDSDSMTWAQSTVRAGGAPPDMSISKRPLHHHQFHDQPHWKREGEREREMMFVAGARWIAPLFCLGRNPTAVIGSACNKLPRLLIWPVSEKRPSMSPLRTSPTAIRDDKMMAQARDDMVPILRDISIMEQSRDNGAVMGGLGCGPL